MIMAKQEPLITVRNVSKSFGDLHVLNNISFELYEGESLAVLGKSGTGKSVLLKLLVGLLEPDQGAVIFHGKEIATITEHELNALRKEIGFLFQSAALFDSMTIGENLNILLSKHTKYSLEERVAQITEALTMVGLADKIDEMPAQLSGGQKKRAGLARSIILRPKLMLFDEPTTGLDPITAAQIAELILSLQTNLKTASILVTHDLPTAFRVCDRMILLQEGKKVYDGPADLKKMGDTHLQDFVEAAKLDHGSIKTDDSVVK
jgi:phospholipid/cholesterol/gamma-HCH transport system ATP-binding protein